MTHALLAGLALVAGLAGGVLLGSFPVKAQLAVEPETLSVAVPQHETAERTVTLTNTGTESLAFCLTFERPLQREAGLARLAEGAAGGEAPCGDYGEVLYRYDEDDFGAGWDPSSITMTPEGRLFVAEVSGLHRTFEFTTGLQLLRHFSHPYVAELTPFAGTPGLTYDTESGTLWWMNMEVTSVNGEIVVRRVMLLEGDFDGVETGGRIEIVPPDTPIEDFFAGGPSYDPATDLFYFLGITDRDDSSTRALWAMDRTGTLAEGYPLRPEPYPPPALMGAPDVHGGAEGGPGGTPGAEGVRVEYAAFPPGSPGFDRIAVVDRWGNNQGEALETPVPAALFEGNGAGVRGKLRSRTDPNGVMYMTFVNFENEGIVGVRPHPLPPSWLVVGSGSGTDEGPEAAWDGVLAPGESRAVVLTFRAGARAVGAYTSSLQAFEAESGEAVEVPLSLTVTEGTDAEDGAEPGESVRLSVFPNPSRGAATVALTLGAGSEATVAVYDVLGRRVAVLHEGRLMAGEHRLAFDGSTLPAGVYLVRVESGERRLTERITLLR